jgi:3-deoxy-manno-octulosonate cytidylyltransferase (CMP-KDO synthetase)
MIGDRTMLHHVHDRASGCREIDQVIVATDDERILREVLAFGGTAVMTSGDHRSGTDRVFEAAESAAPEASYLVNIQGDEPFLDPGVVDSLVREMRARPDAIWTAVAPLADASAVDRPDVVKAVLAADRRVLYFSRAPIPYLRRKGEGTARCWHHIGIYGFPRDLLARFVRAPASPLEEAEGLEQLRALEAGIPIRAIMVEPGFGGIDTAEDLERARMHLRAGNSMGGRRE